MLKRSFRLWISSLVLALLGSFAAHAKSGVELVPGCAAAEKLLLTGEEIKSDEVGDLMYCLGMVNGVVATMTINANSASSPGERRGGICHPDSPGTFVATPQAVAVVNRHLRQYPEKLHEPDFVLIMTALAKAFPCAGAEE